MPKTPKTKRRNPPDATHRNTRASRAQVKFLREWLKRVDARLDRLEENERDRKAVQEDFAAAARRLGYVHSTAPRHQVITNAR